MRWFLRRLVFYVFAVWVALTLNFLLPRLMPGSPIGGILQRLSPAQIQSTRDHPTYGRCSAAARDRSGTTTSPTRATSGLELRSRPEFRHPSRGDRPDTALPDRARRRRSDRFHRRHDDRHDRRVAAGRRGRQRRRAGVHGASAFPAFTALLPSSSAEAQLVPDPARTTTTIPGWNDFISSAIRHGELPVLVIVAAYAGGWVLNMRTVMINTISEDYVAMAHAKGLRDRRVMTRYAGRNAILPPLNGFAAQFAGAVGGLVFIEYVFSYPGAGLTLQQAALGNDYPLTQGLLLVFAICVIASNLIMDLLNFVLDPGARRLMAQVTPSVLIALAPCAPSRRHTPVARPDARQLEVAPRHCNHPFVVIIAAIAPWIATHNPGDSACSTPRRRRASPLGTSDQGATSSRTVIGARRSLILGASAAAGHARRDARHPAAYPAGSSTT